MTGIPPVPATPDESTPPNPFTGKSWEDVRATTPEAEPANTLAGPLLDIQRARARGFSATEAMEAFRLGVRTDLPRDVVLRNLDRVRAETEAFDPEAFVRDAQATARWMSENEANAAVAKDDMEALGTMERLFGEWRRVEVVPFSQRRDDPFTAVPQVAEQTSRGLAQRELDRGWLAVERGQLGSIPEHNRTAAQRTRLTEIETILDTPLPEAEGLALFERMVRGSAQFIPSSVASLAEGLETGLGTATVAGSLMYAAGPAAPVLIPAAALAGFTVGSAVGTYQASARIIEGNAYENYRKAGINAETSRLAASAVGAAGGLLETASYGVLLKPLTEPARRYVLGTGISKALQTPTVAAALWQGAKVEATGVLTETTTETLQQAMELAGEQYGRSVEGMEGVGWERTRNELLATAVQTAIGSILIAAPGAGVTTVTGLQQAAEARQVKDRLTVLGESAKAVTMREALPEAYREIIEAQVAQHGPVEHAYVPIERLTLLMQESGIGEDEFVNRVLGGNPEALEQAKATGGDVVIPWASYVANLAGTELGDRLADDTRLRIGGLTAREAADAEQVTEADLKAMAKEMEALGDITAEPEVAVVNAIFERLVAAGAPETDARANAELTAKPYIVLARRFARDAEGHRYANPLTLWESRNLAVFGATRSGLILDTRAAMEKAQRAGKSVEEMNALAQRLDRLTDERETVRSAVRGLDVRDDAGRLRRSLADVSTDAIAVEYVRLRDAVSAAEGELAGLEETPAIQTAIEMDPGMAEDQAGAVEELASSGNVEGFAGYARLMGQLRRTVRLYRRSVPRLAEELARRGIPDPDMYLRDSDVVGEDTDFDPAVLGQGSLERMMAAEAHEVAAGDTDDATVREIANELNVSVERVRGWLAAPKPEVTRAEMLRVAFLEQAAFHGSPHSFDRFDLSKIGTGEGAQAYGWGLYFAENENVAGEYQRTLSGENAVVVDGVAMPDSDPLYDAAEAIALMGYDKALQSYEMASTSEVKSEGGRKRAKRIMDGIVELSGKAIAVVQNEGALYRVDIPDEAVARMLDWDKPISDAQYKAISVATERDFGSGILMLGATGQETYRELVRTMAREGKAPNVTAPMRAEQSASEYLLALGIPGIKYLDAGSRGTSGGQILEVEEFPVGWVAKVRVAARGLVTTSRPFGTEAEARAWAEDAITGGTRNLVVFDDALVTITHRNGEPVTAQERTDFLAQGQRARPNAFYLFDARTRSRVIGLLPTANRSSFLHEMGHEYLRLLHDVAADPDAPASIRADLEEAVTLIGIEPSDRDAFLAYLQQDFDPKDARAATFVRAEETWARSFESYLREGKAPSRDLREAFRRFRIWLTDIYRAATGALPAVSPELASLFDRLLATEEEMAEVRAAPESQPLLTPEDVPNPTEFAAYQALLADRDTDADAALVKRLLAEDDADRRAAWKRQREEVQSDIEAEVDAEPIQQAVAFLRTNEEGIKLDTDLLKAEAGIETLATIPRGITAEGSGVPVEMLALRFGFADPIAFVEALQTYEPRARRVDRLTAERMRQEHPDLLNDSPALEEAVADAAHRGDGDDLLLYELRVLNRRIGGETPRLEAIRQAARDIINRTTVATIAPRLYAQAERRAALAAAQAKGKGDLAKAEFHKRQQLLNRILFRESTRAVQRADRFRTFAKRMQGKAAQVALGKAGGHYQDAMNDLLDAYAFTTRSGPALVREEKARAGVVAWLADMEDMGIPVGVSDDIVAKATVRHYRTLTYAAMSDLYDAMKQIDFTGRKYGAEASAREALRFAEEKATVLASIEANNTMLQARYGTDRGLVDTARDAADGAHGWLAKPEMVLRLLDGDVPNGPMQQAAWHPFVDAGADETRRMRELVSGLDAIRDDAFTPDRLRDFFGAQLRVKGIVGPGAPNTRMTGQQVLWLALNYGNQTSREAVNAGVVGGTRPFADANVRTLLGLMTADELRAVQRMWDLISVYWPEISAMHKRMTGVAPRKVEASPLTIRSVDGQDVTLPGGYYPLVYDPRYSDIVEGRRQSDIRSIKEGLASGRYDTRAMTRQNHLKSRSRERSGRMVWLDGRVLSNHLVSMTHDLTHREALYRVQKLLTDREVVGAIESAMGRGVVNKTLKPWLRSVAGDQTVPANIFEQLVNHARAGVSVVAMGLRATTTVTQYLGYFPSLDIIGPRYMARGFAEWRKYGMAAVESAKHLGTSVAERSESLDRELADWTRRLARDGKMSRRVEFSFAFIGVADMMVVVPTFWGGYYQWLDQHPMDVQGAIRAGDSAVRLSQGANQAKDLAAAAAGGPWQRAAIMFYSFGSALYNLFWRSNRNLRQGRWSKGRFLGSMLALWFVPAVLETLIPGRGPDEDDTPEEKAKWWAWHLAAFPLQAIPGARDVARAVEPGSPFRTVEVPAYRALSATAKSLAIVGETAWDGLDLERDEALSASELRTLVETVGYWGRLPTGQSWVTGSYIYDWMMGYDVPGTPQEAGRNLLFTRPR